MSYMILEKVRLAWSLVLTKLYFPHARLIRFPSVIRGRVFIKGGRGLTSGYFCRIDAIKCSPDFEPEIFFGTNVQINDSVHIAACKSISIGDNVLIASRVFITDHNHGSFPVEREFHLPPASRKLSYSPVTIEPNVWIGEGAIVLPGVTIGASTVVGAAAVITKSVPPNSLVVGNPARIIKHFNRNTCSWEATG